ncbi:dynamin family protein [Kitasatospora sp. NPDC093806]|uniref:dynamin family protein n=1 Tax=Kitasatospora sp. NPDC093806 TaxID=3155075 RepID=UPI003443D952
MSPAGSAGSAGPAGSAGRGRWWRFGRGGGEPTPPHAPPHAPPHLPPDGHAPARAASERPASPTDAEPTDPGPDPTTLEAPDHTVREATERAVAEAAELLGPRYRAPDALLPALDALDGYRELAARPMRVALVGRVSAGKSTLVNALLGAHRVETGAEELTFNVSRLTHGPDRTVTVHYKDGRPVSRHHPDELRALTARARGDEDPADRDRLRAIDHLVVTDPSPYLRSFDLVDTPGLDSVLGVDSANTLRFLGRSADDVRADSLGHAGSADALVLVFARGLAQGEEELLADFTGAGFGPGGGPGTGPGADPGGGPGGTPRPGTPAPGGTRTPGGALTTVGVLTKTELYWPEHPDPLAEGRRVADRVMTAAGGTRLMYDLRPVCSLVGAAAGQLTEADHADLAALATVEPVLLARRAARGPYFTTRPYPDLPVPADRRERLFGLLAGYGLTLACGLIRDGVDNLPELRAELDRRSGLADFRRLLADHFGARADLIKLRRIVDRARTLPDTLPPGGATDPRLRAAVDRAVGRFVDLEVQQHAFRELTVLRDCYDGRLADLAEADRLELRRVIGEFGTGTAARLGLPEGTGRAELRRAALDRLAHWSTLTTDPTFAGPARRACQVLRRSYERLAAGL